MRYHLAWLPLRDEETSMKIGFATCDWSQTYTDAFGYPVPGGSGYARIVMPGARIQHDGGVECVVGVLVSVVGRDPEGRPLPRRLGVKSHGGTNHTDLDLLVMQRWMARDIADHMAEHRRTGGCPIVNDVDDWFWGLDPRNSAFRATHPKVNPDNNRNHYATILHRSDCVTVSTQYLADRLRPMLPGTRIEVIHNALDLDRWKPHGPDGKDRQPTLGWVGAMPWRSGDLESVQSVIKQVCNENRLVFHHSGVVISDARTDELIRRIDSGDPNADVTEAERSAIEEHRNWFRNAGELMGVARHTETPMAPVEEYPSLFDPIDVGIVPLNDVSFNHAKSWIKGTEYAASGIPFVAQATPEYRLLQEKYGVGRTARRTKDWLRELKLMLDSEWRDTQRERNLAGVQALDIAHRWRDWNDLYIDVAARG